MTTTWTREMYEKVAAMNGGTLVYCPKCDEWSVVLSLPPPYGNGWQHHCGEMAVIHKADEPHVVTG